MSITKTPPKRFYELLDQIVEHEKGTKACFDEAVELLQKKGWNNEEIAMVMHDYLRDKINSKTLQRWIKPLRPIEESTSQSGTLSDNDGKNDTEQEEENPPEISVTTEGSQTSTPAEPTAQEELTEDSKPPDIKEHEPTELELAYIKIEQLETEIQFLKEQNEELKDALHKTQQFKPATALQEPEAVDVYRRLTDDNLFKVLSERDNGVSCYWYDGYGIELFKTRILTQLKGKGVTTFKRLYFEV